MKFQIIERQACIVEWTCIVHASNEAEAVEKFHDGEYETSAPEIGDTIDGYQFELEVSPIGYQISGGTHDQAYDT